MTSRRPASLRARLNALSELGARLDDVTEDRMPAEALEAVVPELGLRAGWVFLADVDAPSDDAVPEEAAPTFVAGRGLPPALGADDACALRSGSCECLSRWRAGRLDRGVNVVTCSRLAKAEGDRGGLERHASVPVRGTRGSLGVLNLAADGARDFGPEELAFLDVVGRQLGAAVQRARLAAEAERAARAEAAAEERARLSADVHDALSNLLFAAELQSRLAAHGDEEALPRLSSVLASARAELRAWIEAARTPDLSDGLDAALARLADRLAPDVTVRVERRSGPGPHESGPHQAARVAALYRAAQEGVHNAVRHGGATVVRIEVSADGGELRLVIEDDGRGCDPEAAARGAGLSGVRTRLERSGGGLAVQRAEAGGLRLIATAPTDAA